MLTEVQIKATKEVASDAVRHWFRGNEIKTLSLANYFAQQVGTFDNPQARERLINQFGYTEKALDEKLELFNESFWASHQWWERQSMIHAKTMSNYNSIFKEAEEVAAKVDISDIEDGFPCGDVSLYLSPDQHNTDLGQALKFMNGNRSADCFTYALPIKFPPFGQCISFSERVSAAVAEFLKLKGIQASQHTWID